MLLYSVRYAIINQKTKLQTGSSGTIISASNDVDAKHIFKCSHVENKKIKYQIISCKKMTDARKSSTGKKSGRKNKKNEKV